MRARNIKPGFFKSEGLASCSFQARLLFIGLWCIADREGRLEDRPARIKAELFPYDNVNVEKLLDELASKKDCDGTPSFIVRYGEQKKYIQILHFLSHQHPHLKESESQIPAFDGVKSTSTIQAPDLHQTCTELARLNPESLLLNPDIYIYSEILDYLNQKAGTKYRDVNGNRKYIKARLNEGYKVDDFKMVIDRKCADWKGKEFEKYLRPETLFGTKFDGYLNEQNQPIQPQQTELGKDFWRGAL